MRLGRVLAGTVILLCAIASCSGSGSGGRSSCASLPSCPNDPATPASETMQCETTLADASCGASFRQYLDCASAQLKCTSTGVIDGTATTAAIAANCGSQGAAYQSCLSGATCGQFDKPCCRGGGPACGAGCCDPQTQRCLNAGMTCSQTNTVCAGTSCVGCGAPGDPCCGTTCPVSGCCDNPEQVLGAGTCVAAGTACKSPPDGGGSLSCEQGYCSSCGTVSINCCPGDVCTEASTLCSGGFCEHCGLRYEPCCAGSACSESGTQCTNGTCN